MKVTVSFKNLEHTESLDSKINKKSKKLEKFLGGKGHVKWTCYVKDNNHYAEVAIHAPKTDYHAKANSDNLYKTLDLVVDKLERQLQKQVDKQKNKLHRKFEEPVILDPENAWIDHDEDIAS